MHLDRSKINLLIAGIIILILGLGVGLAIRPRALFREARNVTRKNHMQVLMTAVYTYAVEHNGLFPECLPEPGQPAVNINEECDEELRPYLMHLVLKDPDPKHNYMIEWLSQGEKRVRIFSTAPEAKKLEVIR